MGSSELRAQFNCNGQDDLNCNCQGPLSNHQVDICIGGMTYTITLRVCHQVPNPNLISNPCASPTCTNPVDLVSWVHEICLPQQLAFYPNMEVVYNAIICATDLCDNNWVGATIPNCDAGRDACTTQWSQYCHILALPNCFEWDANGLCLSTCSNDCTRFCFVWRRYCMDGANCSTCDRSICSYPGTVGPCIGDCLDVDCNDLQFDACCR